MSGHEPNHVEHLQLFCAASLFSLKWCHSYRYIFILPTSMARVAGLVSFQLCQQVISVFFSKFELNSDVCINHLDLDLTVILEMADVFATKLQMAARHRVEIHTLI